MRSNTWARRLALAMSLAALGVFATACSKSSKDKKTNSSQAKLDGTKPTPKVNAGSDKAKGTTATAKTGNPDGTAKAGTKPATTDNGTAGKFKKGGGAKVLADKPEYTVKLVYPKTLANGASGTARLLVTTKTGWKLNNEYPTKLQIVSPSGVSIDKAKQKRGDAVHWAKHSAEFQVKITAKAAGNKPFTGKFKFAVCTKTTCDPKKELLAWVVDVK